MLCIKLYYVKLVFRYSAPVNFILMIDYSRGNFNLIEGRKMEKCEVKKENIKKLQQMQRASRMEVEDVAEGGAEHNIL